MVLPLFCLVTVPLIFCNDFLDLHGQLEPCHFFGYGGSLLCSKVTRRWETDGHGREWITVHARHLSMRVYFQDAPYPAAAFADHDGSLRLPGALPRAALLQQPGKLSHWSSGIHFLVTVTHTRGQEWLIAHRSPTYHLATGRPTGK